MSHRMTMPPSTPNKRSVRTFASHASTTPAGPPPSHLLSVASNTPAGDPPRSSRFGSSYNPTKSPNRYSRRAFQAPQFDGYDDEDDAEFEDDEMDQDAALPSQSQQPAQSFRPTHSFRPDHSFMPAQSSGAPMLASSPPRGLKRSRNGEPRANTVYASEAKRHFIANRDRVALEESDNIILQSEHIISDMIARCESQPSLQTTQTCAETAADLTTLWRQSSNVATKSASVGPHSSNPFTHANYLASLLLQLRYPHTNTPQKAPSRPSRAIVPSSQQQRSIPVPQALLDWLNTYHNPFPDDFDDVHLCTPSPSAHESFWDVVYASLLRGKLDRVIRLLKDAGWEHAFTAEEDQALSGYSDQELDNIEEVVAKCIDALGSCPAYRDQSWDTRTVDWSIFRQRIKTTLNDLESFCESDDMGQSLRSSNVFQRSLGDSLNMSTASRKASSRVPWTIYKNLRLLYGMILGEPDDIIMIAQDWLEGAIYLTVWWDGEDEEVTDAFSRKNNARKGRQIEVAPLQAYRTRLSNAFARVQQVPPEDDEYGRPMSNVFVPDMTERTQLGLACILEDDVGGALFVLRSYSFPISVSVVEIATQDRWLPTVRPSSRGGLADQGFDREDLLVLSQGPTQSSPSDQDRDEILERYAELLSEKPKIGEKEGWELAVAVLTRLDQSTQRSIRIGELLEKLELTTEDTVDKVLNVCDQLGQADQRKNIAERYADTLAESTQSYGPALIYYARAHAADKLKSTVSLITSLCLLHSAAMPDHRLIDPKLSALITKDRPALRELGRIDLEAATLLSSHLSGYATLRRFYELRDQDFNQETSIRLLKPLERRRQAAASLSAVIKSASDCIPGGLFDPEAETVIPVDGLLALFGETLPLLGQPQRVFTESQVFALLAALEDFVAAPSRIRENAVSLLSASLNAYREETSTASGPFKRQQSNLSESSSWEMLASTSMIASKENLKKGEKIQRAWDWRLGLVQGGIETKQEQIVRLVREALVREVASGWGGKLNW